MKPSDIITIYQYWDGNTLMSCVFLNKEVEVLWVRLLQKCIAERRSPTRIDYVCFIEEHTPEYFKPKYPGFIRQYKKSHLGDNINNEFINGTDTLIKP